MGGRFAGMALTLRVFDGVIWSIVVYKPTSDMCRPDRTVGKRDATNNGTGGGTDVRFVAQAGVRWRNFFGKRESSNGWRIGCTTFGVKLRSSGRGQRG